TRGSPVTYEKDLSNQEPTMLSKAGTITSAMLLSSALLILGSAERAHAQRRGGMRAQQGFARQPANMSRQNTQNSMSGGCGNQQNQLQTPRQNQLQTPMQTQLSSLRQSMLTTTQPQLQELVAMQLQQTAVLQAQLDAL